MRRLDILLAMSMLVSICGPSLADPLELTVAGEIQPTFTVKNQQRLDTYKHEKIEYITFHHQSLGGDNRALFEEWRQSHEAMSIKVRVDNINTGHVNDKNFGTIAYNYIIDKPGKIARGRPVAFAPATNTDYDFKGHVAVMVLGNYEFEELPNAARLSLVKVMSAAQRKFKVPTSHIKPHKHHVATTECPGKHILDQQEDIAAMTQVYSIQTELTQRSCRVGLVDGVAGSKTTGALLRLQQANPGKFSHPAISDEMLWELVANPTLGCTQQ